MDEHETHKLVFDGVLVVDGEKIEGEFLCETRYSLLVNLKDRTVAPEEEFPFENLLMSINGKELEFGKGRFLPRQERHDIHGYLVFTEELHDFRTLLMETKLVRPRSSFFHLALILKQKSRIWQSFRDFTASLTYDLRTFREYFDEIDSRLTFEDEEVREESRSLILKGEGKKFNEFFDENLDRMKEEISDFSQDYHERHGYYFRKQLWDFITESAFMERTNRKPRRYAGDSWVVRMIQENQYQGDDIFSRLMHKHPLEATFSRAIRSRRDMVRQTIAEIRSEFPGESLRFLAETHGDAANLEAVFGNKGDIESLEGYIMNPDEISLEETQAEAGFLTASQGGHPNLKYVMDSIRTISLPGRAPDNFNNFHFIYSMGLFDYLLPAVARHAVKYLYGLLRPGGRLLIGNMHADNPDRHYMEYWCDWTLYYRSEEEFVELLSDEQGAERMVSFDETGIQMFLHIKKTD